MDLVIQCTTLPSHSRSLNRLLFHFPRRLTSFYRLSHSELVDIEKVPVCFSLRSLKPKRTIESRATRSSINLTRTLFQYTCPSYTVKTRNLRVLRIILVILPEHQSDMKVFTVTKKILSEPTSNKLCGRKNKKEYSKVTFWPLKVYPAVVSLPSGSSQGKGMICLHSTSSYPRRRDWTSLLLFTFYLLILVIFVDKATIPGNPGRLVAGDRFSGRHIARETSNEKARMGYLSGRHRQHT
nr:hypothetical protein [Tanacetum cinerariifolium]